MVLEAREAFRLRGEQIDGSFVLGHETYVLEAKWQSGRHQDVLKTLDLGRPAHVPLSIIQDQTCAALTTCHLVPYVGTSSEMTCSAANGVDAAIPNRRRTARYEWLSLAGTSA